MKVKEVEIGPLKIFTGFHVFLEECIPVSVDTRVNSAVSLEDLAPRVQSSSNPLSVASQNLDANMIRCLYQTKPKFKQEK